MGITRPGLCLLLCLGAVRVWGMKKVVRAGVLLGVVSLLGVAAPGARGAIGQCRLEVVEPSVTCCCNTPNGFCCAQQAVCGSVVYGCNCSF